jgi:DHA1 family quinolone resistance protein-like MFS transporter
VRIFTGVAVGLYPAALVDYVTRRNGKLGQYSAFGSLGFGAGNFVASILVQYYTGITGAFLMAAIAMFVGFAVALTLRPVPEIHHKVPLFPRRLIRKNIHIYAPMLLRHSGATGIWVYWPLFILTLKGSSILWIGIIQFINPLAQFVFMYWYTDRIRARWLFPVGLLLSCIVMISFTIVTNVWQLLPTQVLLGVAWSCTYVGALRTVTEGSEEKSTVAGLLTSVTSVSQVIGPAISTVMVSATHIYRTEMFIGAAMSLAALGLYLVLRKYAQEDGPVTASSAGTTPPP